MEAEKAVMLTKKAEDYKEPPPEVKKEKTVNLFAEFNGTATTEAKEGQRKRINMCACGDTDPKFKGYCENCVKKFSAKFTK
jgi:hypothetical protein